MPPLIFSDVLTELNAWAKKKESYYPNYPNQLNHVTSGLVALEVYF